MQKLKSSLIAILLISISISCEKDKGSDVDMPDTATTIIDQQKLEITDEVVSIFKKNYYNVNDIKIIDFMLPDGTIEQRYQLEDDLLFSADQLKSLSYYQSS